MDFPDPCQQSYMNQLLGWEQTRGPVSTAVISRTAACC